MSLVTDKRTPRCEKSNEDANLQRPSSRTTTAAATTSTAFEPEQSNDCLKRLHTARSAVMLWPMRRRSETIVRRHRAVECCSGLYLRLIRVVFEFLWSELACFSDGHSANCPSVMREGRSRRRLSSESSCLRGCGVRLQRAARLKRPRLRRFVSLHRCALLR